MERESYSIDDILSEVKQRRAERENPDYEIKNQQGEAVTDEQKNDEPFSDIIEITPSGSQKADFSKEDEPSDIVYSNKNDGLIDKGLQEPINVDLDDIHIKDKNGEDVDTEPVEVNDFEEVYVRTPNGEERLEDNASKVDEDNSVDLMSFADNGDDSAVQKEAKADNQTSDDISEKTIDIDKILDEPLLIKKGNAKAKDDEEKEEKVKFSKTKKGKFLRNIIIIILVMVLGAAVFGGLYIHNALKQVTDNQPQREEEWQGMSQLVENFPEIQETEATELTSLQDMIKTWYYNGAPCSSTHVLNVLLIGEDTRGSDILEEETRADSAIIASINIDTKEITLTSILRDAYAYWENTEGDESSGVFEKINGAMSIGDVHTYIKTVEKLYKIDIDNYVIVNFDSFEKIIDEVGGVTLELTSAEIREINNHPKRYGNVTIEQTFDGTSGEVLLNGKQALAYCRIRKLDSDNMRADRQKTCLVEMLNKVKDSSKVTLLKIVNDMLPYVKTGFSSNEIISIAKYALSQGWLGFDVNMTSVPYSRINERGIGGTYYGAWIWRPDYPADAYYLQTLIYGKSSITLAQERVDVIGCRDYGFYSETLTPCYAVIHNYAYGEVTTYEFQNKETESTSTTD